MKNPIISSILSLGLAGFAPAATVFTDDFESPNASTTYTVANTSKLRSTSWVAPTNGFGSDRAGIVDEGHASEVFSDPVGAQAYGFRYTNSGVTSAYNVIGQAAAGMTITVYFDVVKDGYKSNGTDYSAALVTFNGAGTRTSTLGLGDNTSSVLATKSAVSFATTTYQTVSFSYTIDAVSNAAIIGHDLSIRFLGDTNNKSLIDNVRVDIATIPEPSAALLGAIGCLLLLRRRRD